LLKFPKQLYLASKSPRRAKLLQQIGLNFIIIDIDFVEKIDSQLSPSENVTSLSLMKAKLSSSTIKNGIVLTADTIVVMKNEVLGKPSNDNEARIMLKKLSNTEHKVYTGFTLIDFPTNLSITDFETTIVKFRKLSDDEIEDYIATGSPLDKAGAYGIQDDYGSVFVKGINGCFYNVVGFPLSKFYITAEDFIKKYSKENET
jgi:septum formation protein